MIKISIPVINLRGDPSLRGSQYGSQASSAIKRSLGAYQAMFKHFLNQDWDDIRQQATKYIPAILGYRPHLMDEMAGIAQGAGLTLEDILVLNLRTEFLNKATAIRAARECTAIAALPSITQHNHTLVGQNWDWNPLTADTLVILAADPQDGRPSFITLVEAGMLAKTGMNAAGLGLATNALVTDQDGKDVGIPYHVILRGILEADSIASANAAVPTENRASAANYLIAHVDGQAINIETAPGGKRGKMVSRPQRGMIAHTNHFVIGTPGFKDLGFLDGDDSLLRYQSVQNFFASVDRPVDVNLFEEIFSDHEHYPYGICCHVNETKPPAEQYASLASIIMNLNTATMWVAGGNPCQTNFTEYNYQGFFNQDP
jgi:isopenicillin-N N-acyltransferase-like protein